MEVGRMNPRIPIDRDRIEEFCRRWRIVELALFGSVLRDDFAPQSDVDVMVRFASDVRYGLFDLARIQEELEVILGRKVDLVERQAVERSQNYIRRQHILGHAEILYVAR
jgi:hypothetical protein